MTEDTVPIPVPGEEAYLPLLRLVLGSIAARQNICFDDLDDVQLAVEDLVAQRVPDGGRIVMAVEVVGACLSITVEARLDQELGRHLRSRPLEGEDLPDLDTSRLLWSLMDSVSAQELPSGRFSVHMTKRCR